MSGPVVVVSPAELRTLVREAVREALDAGRRERTPDPGAWLDTAGAAELLGVHPRTVTKAAKAGDLACSRIGKLYRFRRADVLAFLDRG